MTGAFLFKGAEMAKKANNGYPIPNVIDPPESMQVTLCVPKNRDHLATFFGALFELTIWTSWQKDTAHSAVEVADVWSRYWYSWDRNLNDIECEDDMGKCCTEPIKESRLNPDTGRPEVRYDGGAWKPDPSDPQFAVFAQPPIVGGGSSNTKCDAASNALQHFTDVVNATSSNIATASSVYTFAVAIVTVLLEVAIIIITGGLGSPIALTIVGMIWGAGSAVFTAGQAAFDDYWSTDNLDIVFCALYCNIGENGQFTEDQYQAWRTQVNFELPSSPARDLVMTTINAAGAVGLSNMASYGGSADSDCSECGCDPEPTVWFVNANEEIVGLFPDEDGFYTAETGSDTVYPGLWYGTIWFREPPPTNESPYANCWNIGDVTYPSGAPTDAGIILCATGGYQSFPWTDTCYAAIQKVSNSAPWSIRFTVNEEC